MTKVEAQSLQTGQTDIQEALVIIIRKNVSNVTLFVNGKPAHLSMRQQAKAMGGNNLLDRFF
jgi:hypothetical protein